jgi:hypothetical protein
VPAATDSFVKTRRYPSTSTGRPARAAPCTFTAAAARLRPTRPLPCPGVSRCGSDDGRYAPPTGGQPAAGRLDLAAGGGSLAKGCTVGETFTLRTNIAQIYAASAFHYRRYAPLTACRDMRDADDHEFPAALRGGASRRPGHLQSPRRSFTGTPRSAAIRKSQPTRASVAPDSMR